MVTPILNSPFYTITNTIESNTTLNRGIVDVFGYGIPTSINANNKDEARERILSSTMYFGAAFLSPLVMLPIFNKAFLKHAGIIKNFGDKGVEIVRLSKEHLVGDADKMQKGIKDLVYDLRDNPNTSKKTRAKFKNIEQNFDNILNRFPDKEALRVKLLKADTKIAIADYLTTGAMFTGTAFGIRELTKKITGRTGFSAEYKMADDKYTKNGAKKQEKIKKEKILASAIILTAGAFAINKTVQKAFLSKAPKGIMKWIKNNAAKFDYTGGKFMKIMPYFLISMIGDFPSYLLCTRDKYELRDSAVRTAFCGVVFFGGQPILNTVFARLLDHKCGTKLVNKEKLGEKPSLWKKLTAPTYSLEELSKKTDWDTNILKRTRKFGVGMHWSNLALIILCLGTVMPKALNHLLKRNVHEDLAKQQNNNINYKWALKNKNCFSKMHLG